MQSPACYSLLGQTVTDIYETNRQTCDYNSSRRLMRNRGNSIPKYSHNIYRKFITSNLGSVISSIA
jgi:DNA-directed RNA polymerase subunit RPC12/RpoP